MTNKVLLEWMSVKTEMKMMKQIIKQGNWEKQSCTLKALPSVFAEASDIDAEVHFERCGSNREVPCVSKNDS